MTDSDLRALFEAWLRDRAQVHKLANLSSAVLRAYTEAVTQAAVRPPSRLLDAILAADERGQGLPFAEAMYEASRYLRRQSPTEEPRLDLPTLLRKSREQLGLSLQGLASKVGCSKAHLWEIESGRSANPTIGLLVGLSKALALPVEHLALAAAVIGEREQCQSPAEAPPAAEEGSGGTSEPAIPTGGNLEDTRPGYASGIGCAWPVPAIGNPACVSPDADGERQPPPAITHAARSPLLHSQDDFGRRHAARLVPRHAEDQA